MANGNGTGRVMPRWSGLATVKRYLGTLTLTNGQSAFLDLPRDFLYAGLLLRFRGTFTVAGGTTSGTLHDDNPMSYLRRIVVEGTGGGAATQLKNVRGIHAYRVHHLLAGVETQAAPITSAGVQTGTAFSANLSINFVSPGAMLVPELAVQSILDPSEFSALKLEIQAGDDTDFVNGGDRTETVASALVDVYALQAINVAIRGRRPYRFIETYLWRESVSALATERQFTNKLPTGRPYRYLLVRTLNEGSNTRQPVDDTLGDVKVFISQTLVQRYSDFREYAEVNRQNNRVVTATNPAGLNALGSRDNPVVGSYMFDFAEGGRLDGILDASRFPLRGVTLDFLHDIDTASARVIEAVAGFLVPGGVRR